MNASYRFALRVFGEFGLTMAIPAVLAALVGQKLDQGQGYRYTAMFLALAFLLTGVWVARRTKELAKTYQNIP